MWKVAGNSGKEFISFCFKVIALAAVFFTPVCLAQNPTTGNPVSGNLVLVTGNSPIGTQLLDNAGGLTVAPGGNYIFTITLTSGSGAFQSVGTGQNAMSLSAYAWPGFASNNYTPGPLDPNVTLSNFQFIDSTHASFALSVSSGASTGVDQIQASEFSAGAVWPIFIQPSSPPGLPNPPSPSTSCGTPAIASVTPDTWMAGQSYPITIVGSGFTNAAMAAANSNCTANQLTVSVPAGSVTLSNVVIMDSTKITATVQPVQTDPTENATLILWGASSGGVLVARARTGANAMADTAATPVDAGGPPGLQQVATGNAKVANGKLYVIDPYLVASPDSTSISESDVISRLSNYSSVQAKGMITDGSATAIAVYKIGVNKQITFTGTGGLEFESWNPSFLNYPPSYGNCGGSCSIDVIPQIQGSDGNYYAFALVLAPPQGSSTSYGFQAGTVTASVATDSGPVSSKPTYLDIGPTPVIFVHGLWANAATFDEMRTNLGFAQPWQTFLYKYGVLTAMCYDATVPFDFGGPDPSTAGPPPSNAYVTANCEKASSTAISQAIGQIQTSLDNVNYVGGRVDIIAHSMGGLAARHYTATSLYSSSSNAARSRSVGPLRTIIAIDTPETGSPLARALLFPAIAHSTCASPLIASSGNLCTPASGTWFAVCPASAESTFAQCFRGSTVKKPIGPGSSPETIAPCIVAGQSDSGCGAVASLAPNSPNIVAAPRIDAIQNQFTKWFAIESDWRDNGDNSSSALRSFFNDLLAAMELHSPLPDGVCPQTQLAPYSPPTLLCLMEDDPNNDVIVPTSSQGDDTSGNLVEFFNAAHASLGLGNVLPQYWAKSDANILDRRADNCVVQILLTSTIQGCSAAPSPATTSQALRSIGEEREINVQAAPGESLEDAIERTSHPMKLNTRIIELEAANTDAAVGSPIRLHLTVPPGKISTIQYHEQAQHGDIDTGDSGIAKVVEDEGENKTIEVRPLQLGEVYVSVSVLYADNSTGKQSVKLNVVPSEAGLTQFAVDQGFHDIELKLGGNKGESTHWLVPMVTYSGVKYPIRLDDSTRLSFAIDQTVGDPVIQLDRDGLIHALRLGEATITADFAGVRDQIKVRVSGD